MANLSHLKLPDGTVLDLAGGGGASLPTGGTTGQVLAKKSDADDDVEWSDYATQVVSNGRLIKINTNPSSYTTVTGGFKPSYRVAKSAFTVNTTNISNPQIGDLVYYSSYYYYIGYVDTTYVYLSARVSIVGPAGAAGAAGKNGSVYASSAAPTGSGPWVFTASNLSPTYSSQTTANFLIYYGGYFYAATSASTTTITCNSRFLIPTDTPTTLAGLTDTLISSPSDGQTLVWDATAQAWKNGDASGGAGLVIIIPEAYATVVTAGGTYFVSNTISKSNIESALQSGGAINFTFFNSGTFDGEAALIGYEEYSDSWSVYQRGLAVLTDGSVAYTFTVEFSWNYQNKLESVTFTALSSGGGGNETLNLGEATTYGGGQIAGLSANYGSIIPVATTGSMLPLSYFQVYFSNPNTGGIVTLTPFAYKVEANNVTYPSLTDYFTLGNPQDYDFGTLKLYVQTSPNLIYELDFSFIVNLANSSVVLDQATSYQQAYEIV